MLTWSYDTNAILVRLLRALKGIELLDNITKIHDYSNNWGYKQNHDILYKEEFF